MENATARRGTVLAVDDQRANLVALDAVLGSEFDLVIANSGMEALALLERSQDVDVILMDVQMPGMDGFETASRIKAKEGCRDIPIVFITAVYNEDPFIKQGYKVGAVDYFSKPFDPEILKLKVAIYASFRQRAHLLKERARQIRESEELLHAGRRLSATLERLQVGVIITDAAGRAREASGVALGAEPTILGLWRRDGELVNSVPDFLVRALRGEDSSDSRLEIRPDKGSGRLLVCTAAPARDLNGSLVGAVVLVHDVTEGKEMSRELETRISRMASSQTHLVTS